MPGEWAVEVRVDGDGASRLVGPMCDDCWAELTGAGFGPSLAADSFAPPMILARLAAAGSPEDLLALASRGADRLPSSVLEAVRGSGLDVPANGRLVDVLEVRAFAATSTPVVSVRRVSKLMLAGVAVVAVAAAVATFAATRVLRDASADDGSPASTIDTVSTMSPSTTMAATSTSSSTSSTSTVSPTTSTVVATTSVPVPSVPSVTQTTAKPPSGTAAPVTNPPATNPPAPVTTSPPPAASWVSAAADSCTSAAGVPVTIRWSATSGTVTSSRLLLNGSVVASGGGSVTWSGDGAAASGSWVAEVKVSGSWAGQMSMSGCA